MPESTHWVTDAAYWDGYVIGEAGPDIEPVPNTSAREAWRDMAFARGALKNRLDGMTSYYPIKTIQHGQEFDANEYAPGTVILTQRETLSKSLWGNQVCLNLLAKAGATRLGQDDLPTGMQPSLKPLRSDGLFTLGPGSLYSITTKWGVVVAHEEGHYLRSVDTMLTHVTAWGNSVVPPFPRRTLPAAFVVGDVMGRVAPPRQAGQPSVDFYQRITNADIAGIGGKKRRNPSPHRNILEWLGVAGRPGIGPSRI